MEFHKTELEKALSEQRYGIVAYRIDHEACTSHVAFGIVYLLEQQQLRVNLSNRGYLDCSGTDLEDPEVFETLEGLLLARSPMYRQRRTEELIARLSQVADFST